MSKVLLKGNTAESYDDGPPMIVQSQTAPTWNLKIATASIQEESTPKKGKPPIKPKIKYPLGRVTHGSPSGFKPENKQGSAGNSHKNSGQSSGHHSHKSPKHAHKKSAFQHS
jgi:hypothetical protein